MVTELDDVLFLRGQFAFEDLAEFLLELGLFLFVFFRLLCLLLEEGPGGTAAG